MAAIAYRCSSPPACPLEPFPLPLLVPRAARRAGAPGGGESSAPRAPPALDLPSTLWPSSPMALTDAERSTRKLETLFKAATLPPLNTGLPMREVWASLDSMLAACATVKRAQPPNLSLTYVNHLKVLNLIKAIRTHPRVKDESERHRRRQMEEQWQAAEELVKRIEPSVAIRVPISPRPRLGHASPVTNLDNSIDVYDEYEDEDEDDELLEMTTCMLCCTVAQLVLLVVVILGACSPTSPPPRARSYRHPADLAWCGSQGWWRRSSSVSSGSPLRARTWSQWSRRARPTRQQATRVRPLRGAARRGLQSRWRSRWWGRCCR
jgi:hypothetical protein